MSPRSFFLIGGGTGRQGSAVVNALLSDPHTPQSPSHIYVLTRDPTGNAAKSIAARGVNLIMGNLDKPVEIFNHLKKQGIDLQNTTVFLAQAHGPSELSDARTFIDAAATSKIAYFVYSSVDRGGKQLSDRDASYCKTFSDKFLIEQYLRAVCGQPSPQHETSREGMEYTILRPVWFADNADWGFPGRLCMTGWRDYMGGKRMQIVTTTDIGKWAAEALLRPDKAGLRNEAVSIASDELTYQEADAVFREEMGRSIEVTNWVLARLMIWCITDLRTMFGWINERNYGADLQELGKTVAPTTFRDWVRDRMGGDKRE